MIPARYAASILDIYRSANELIEQYGEDAPNPYFFGFHSRASFWASAICAGVILLAMISRFLIA